MSKRFFTFLSLLVMASMVLAACGGGAATQAPAAATQAPAAATQAPAVTEAPATTEAPAAAATTEAAAMTEAPSAAATTEAAAAPATSGELKVAILAPLTGQVPTFGESTKNGAMQAIDEWNAKGGVLGMKITPVVEDSQCSAEPAVNAANKVIDQDKVHYIIGEVCSSASIPVSEITEAKKIVQISPTSTNPSVTLNQDGSTKQYVFRACFTDAYQGQVQAQFALNELKAKTAFLLYDQGNDYVRGLSEYFEKAFTAGGGTIVGKETYTSTDTDFSAILAKVSQANPDVVQLPDYYNIVNLVTAQAKQLGITAPFVGGDGWDSADLDVKSAAGGYFTNHYAPDDPRPIVQDFVKNYKDKFGGKSPDALAALAYDATNMLLQAITNAGADDTTKVSDALATGTFEGVSGTIKLDEHHDPIKTVTILQVTDTGVKFLTQVKPQQ